MKNSKVTYDPDNPRFLVDKFFSKDEDDFVHWEGVFEEYSMCTDRFIRVIYNQYDDYSDAPYWNNERTNVGMLAASCWKNGWIALEEYSTEKMNDDEENGSGRCDLWISSQSGKKNYAIEAKKGHCALGTGDEINTVMKLLDAACKDASNLSEEEGDECMGMAFMHLYLNHNKVARASDIIDSILIKLNESVNNDRFDFAYIYLKDNGVESNRSIIPGVIIAGRTVK